MLCLPCLDITELVDKDVKVDRFWRIEVVIIVESTLGLLRCQRLVEGVLIAVSGVHVTFDWLGAGACIVHCASALSPSGRLTIDMIVTQGRFRLLMMAIANDVLPDPELPATPMMLALPHGGE